MAPTTLITGGVRSGKSRFAEQQTLRYQPPLCYLATPRPSTTRWRNGSPSTGPGAVPTGKPWTEPLALPQTLARLDGTYGAILVDCVTLWLTNLLLARDHNDTERNEQIVGTVHRLATTLRAMQTPVILVTNEVGMGIVPEHRLGRLFRDLAGQANQILAASCDEVYTLICGLPLKLK